MDSNQEESLDILKLQGVLYTDGISQSQTLKQCQNPPSSRPSSQALNFGDDDFNREVDKNSMTSAESNHYHREPLIPTDPIEPPSPHRQLKQRQEQQEQLPLRSSSPPPLPFQMINTNNLNSHNNTTTYSAHAYNDTGVDRTGTLTLGYSASQDGYDIEETQRDPDSYTERMQHRMEHQSQEHHIVFDNDYNEDADTQQIDDDDDDGDDTQNLNHAVLFDENKRFAPTPKVTKRKRNGSLGGDDDDEEDDLPLAGLGENDAPLGLTQLFQASSPVRRPVSSRLNTSPAVAFANNAGMPVFANGRNNNNNNESPSLGLRKIVTEAAAMDYVSLQESQERRNGQKKASPKQKDDDDDDDDVSQDPVQARYERERRERNRIKSVEAQLKNVTAKPRANAVRYGRKPKDKTKSSPQTSSPTNTKGSPRKDINKSAAAVVVDLENEDIEMQDESTEDIRALEGEEDPTQEDSLKDGGAMDEDEEEIQVPSTAKKSSKRSPKGAPEDTPVRAPRRDADDDAEVFVSNSQDEENAVSQRSAISDSQPNGLKEPITSSLGSASQRRRNDITPKTIHDFSAGTREQIVAMIGPLTSSVPRNNDKESSHAQSIVPESSSPPRASVKDRDAPPSSPPLPPPARSTRRTVFESRHVERRGTEPITETPRMLRGGKTFSVPPTSQGAKGSSTLDTVRTPYPEKGIPAIQPTTIPETSPYRGQDNSPAPFRPAASNVLRSSRRLAKDTSIEIPCSMSEDNGASKTKSKTKSIAQAPSSDVDPKPQSTTTTSRGANLFPQAKKRAADPLTDFNIPVPKKRFRRQKRSSAHVVQDSYDISSHQLCPSSENVFSSPSPSIIDEEAQQQEDQTPASPPISSPLTSPDKIAIPRSSVANRSIVKETSLSDKVKENRTTPRKRTSKSTVRGPGKRVFAQFKGGNHGFYPATVVVDAVIAVATEIGVRFDDGTSCTLSKLKVRRLDLRKGDMVKVDRPGLKTKNWIVEGVKTSADKPEYTDIHGNDIVVLKQKQAGKNNGGGGGKDGGEEIEVPISQLYLTSTQWPQFHTRFVPFDEAGPETSPSAMSRSPSSTPKVQLRTPPTVNYTSDVASISATAGPMTSGGLFSGMLFAISYGDKDIEKKALIQKIEQNGGKIVNHGFAELFTQPAKSGKYDVALLDGVERWGFACVIADKHSRTLKYLQALALGLPCLAGRWVDVCVKKKTVIPWEDYLLPAGESSHLNNAIKSRVLQPVLAKEARFIEMFQDRKKLFNGYNVIFVMGGNKVEEKRKPHLFLIHTLGATSVERITSIDAACKHLSKVVRSTTTTPLSAAKYVMITKNFPRDLPEPVKKKKAILLDDEWLIQSLIMGRLLDPEDS